MLYKRHEENLNPSLKADGELLSNYKVSSEEDEIIDFVRWNQSLEGFDMPLEDEKACRKILKGEITAQESIDEFLSSRGYKR